LPEIARVAGERPSLTGRIVTREGDIPEEMLMSKQIAAALFGLAAALMTRDALACPEGQFEMDGRCWNIGYQCSDYDGTTSRVCNNGSDDLRCDWDSRSHTCYPEY
jgi:hypothetical protein